MCNPTVLTTLSIVAGVGQTAAGYIGQMQQASAQAEYEAQLARARAEQIAENNRLSQESYNNQVRLEQIRLQQEQAQDSQKKFVDSIEARKAMATTYTSAGESGVSGLSIDRLLADFSRQNAMFNDSINQNYEYQVAQSQERIKGYKAEAEGRMNSLQPYIPQPVARPSLLGAGLQIGSQIIGGMQRYKYYTNRGA